tara:strand:+ start:431 stop:1009 length:579 start_codon:yes stop_codon:yes gene_type:complete
MKKSLLQHQIEESSKVKTSLIRDEKKINQAINKIAKTINLGKTIYLCGNGGSAADAQHLVAEMLIRLRPHVNRRAIPFISLAMDSSTLTACANDYGYNYVFSRPLSALAKKGDVIITISTTGNSQNILEALKIANKKEIYSIGFLGGNGGKAKKYCNLPIIVNSKITARIQEAHIFLGHHILEQCENKIIKR